MSWLSTLLRYLLAAIVGAVAVPAAAVAVEFGALMLLVGLIWAGTALFGRNLFQGGAERLVPAEVLVVLLGTVLLVGLVEITRHLAGGVARRPFYKRAITTGAIAAVTVFPFVGFVAYATLHGRSEPGLPPALIVTAIVAHVVAGSVAWPIWVLHPELRATAPNSDNLPT